MPVTEPVTAPAWPLSDAEILALHDRWQDEVQAAVRMIPFGIPVPPLDPETFAALAFKAEFVGILKGLLMAQGVPHNDAHWLGIDAAAHILDGFERLQTGFGPVGHA
jgi:hypothetical protein